MAGLNLDSADVPGYASFTALDQPPMAPRGQVERKWQQDTKSCCICREKFGDILNRRHHCRSCGKCVCHDCSPNQIQLDGTVVRVCNPCLMNGVGAVELLPALAHLRSELCGLIAGDSYVATLPPAQDPAQAVAECIAAVDPLRRRLMVVQGADDQQIQSPAAVKCALLSAELEKERECRRKSENKLGGIMEGMSQLDRMLKGIHQSADRMLLDKMLKGLNQTAGISKVDVCDSDINTTVESAKAEFQPGDEFRQMERMLASCTLSAGVWLHRKKTGEYKRPVPVLSRMMTEDESSSVSPASASTTDHSSNSSDSSDSELGTGSS